MPLAKELRYECERCNASYHPRHKAQRYCSKACARRVGSGVRNLGKPLAEGRPVVRLKEVRQCAFCGRDFHPSQRSVQCCSRSCARNLEHQLRQEAGGRGVAWKGGRIVRKDGYVEVWVGKGHPGALSNGYMPEHRHVMAQALGRPLLRTESVHHINGDRTDNRLENLQLRNSQWHGPGQAMICLDCGSSNVAHTPLKEA